MPTAERAPEAGRIPWIDASRGLSVLLVVVFHVLLWHLTPLAGDMWHPAAKWWLKFNSVLGSLRLPLLLGVSGMLASSAILTGFPDRRNAGRIAANYYLYVVWLAVYWAFFVVVTTPDLPHRFVSWTDFAFQLISPNTTLWYVFALALYTLVLCALKDVVPGVLQIVLFVALCVVSRTIDVEARQTLKIGENAIFFIAGVYAAPLLRRLADRANVLWVGVAAVVAVLVTLCGRLSDSEVALSFVFMARGMAFSVWAVLSVSLIVSWRPAAWSLTALGRQTLPIYVIHPLWIYLLITWTQSIAGFARFLSHPLVSVLYPIVVPLIIVAACLAVHRLALSLRLRWLFELPRGVRAKLAR